MWKKNYFSILFLVDMENEFLKEKEILNFLTHFELKLGKRNLRV